MKFSTFTFLATVGSAAAFAPSTGFQARTATLNMATEAAEETKVRLFLILDLYLSFLS